MLLLVNQSISDLNHYYILYLDLYVTCFHRMYVIVCGDKANANSSKGRAEGLGQAS